MAYEYPSNANIATDKAVRASDIRKIRDMVPALAAGEAGAPKIQMAALQVVPVGVTGGIVSGWPSSPNTTGGPIFISAELVTGAGEGVTFTVDGNDVFQLGASSRGFVSYIVGVGETFSTSGSGTVAKKFYRK
jgi:hypothetical protein